MLKSKFDNEPLPLYSQIHSGNRKQTVQEKMLKLLQICKEVFVFSEKSFQQIYIFCFYSKKIIHFAFVDYENTPSFSQTHRFFRHQLIN